MQRPARSMPMITSNNIYKAQCEKNMHFRHGPLLSEIDSLSKLKSLSGRFQTAEIGSDGDIPFSTLRCNDNISSNPIAKDKTGGIETPYGA